MIRGTWGAMPFTYSQTLNRYDALGSLIVPGLRMEVLSGPFLVSRTGDAG
jgi:hypothetical protein